MNKVLEDILRKNMEKEEEGIIKIDYTKEILEKFNEELKNSLKMSGIEHIDNPIIYTDVNDEGGREYVLQFRKVYELVNLDNILVKLLAPYKITRLATFGLITDKCLDDIGANEEIDEYIRTNGEQFTVDGELVLIKKPNHQEELLKTMSKL